MTAERTMRLTRTSLNSAGARRGREDYSATPRRLSTSSLGRNAEPDGLLRSVAGDGRRHPIEPPRRIPQIPVAHDVVRLEHAPGLVPGHLHSYPFWDARPHEVPPPAVAREIAPSIPVVPQWATVRASIEIEASLAGVDFYRANGFIEAGRGEARLKTVRSMEGVFMRKQLAAVTL
jgi:hypothetical protein